MEQEQSDRFKTIMGILIAAVALVTALAAWRAAVAARTAGAEDYLAVVSVLQAAQTNTTNYALTLSHLTAFTDFAINDEMLTQLLAEPDDPANDAAIVENDRLAATNRTFFPARFANQDGTYDIGRELAEEYAREERMQDLTPQDHLEEASRLDSQAFVFVQSAIVSSAALLFFTLASVLHPQRRFLRYGAALLGIGLLVVSIVQITLTEIA